MIHGIDVSRAILAVHAYFSRAVGERWLLTDGRVYDWWDLASAWGDAHTRSSGYPSEGITERSESEMGRSEEEKGPQPRWVRELMNEQGVKALPRSVSRNGSFTKRHISTAQRRCPRQQVPVVLFFF